jgi:hypothetical protein
MNADIPMCEKCVQFNETIERYRRLIRGTSDRLAIESAENLIKEAERRKAELHPDDDNREPR